MRPYPRPPAIVVDPRKCDGDQARLARIIREAWASVGERVEVRVQLGELIRPKNRSSYRVSLMVSNLRNGWPV